jgi:hypothetical protein
MESSFIAWGGKHGRQTRNALQLTNWGQTEVFTPALYSDPKTSWVAVEVVELRTGYRVSPRSSQVHLVFVLDNRLEHCPFIDMQIITSSIRLTQKQYTTLAQTIDDSIPWNLIRGIRQSSERRVKIADMNHVFGKTSCLDNSLPLHPGIYPNTTFQMVRFSTAIDSVGLT